MSRKFEQYYSKLLIHAFDYSQKNYAMRVTMLIDYITLDSSLFFLQYIPNFFLLLAKCSLVCC